MCACCCSHAPHNTRACRRRDKYLLQSFTILELYLEHFSQRCKLIAKTKEIPRDLVEAVASVIYAARVRARIMCLGLQGPG